MVDLKKLQKIADDLIYVSEKLDAERLEEVMEELNSNLKVIKGLSKIAIFGLLAVGFLGGYFFSIKSNNNVYSKFGNKLAFDGESLLIFKDRFQVIEKNGYIKINLNDKP